MYILWCRSCCLAAHPIMMTGYSIPGSCDRCGRSTMLAIVKPAERGVKA